MQIEQIFAELHKVNFSQYEARAYVALLQSAPVTGYELSKRSGVPRSMIYEVLGKLLDRGAVHTVPTEPVTYAPVPAQALIDRLRHSTEQTLSYLEQTLGALEHIPEVDTIRHIRGRDPVLTEMRSLITRTRRELWLSLWADQIADLADAVQAAQAREAQVFSVLFDETSTRLGLTFYHAYMPPEVVEQRLGGHLHIVSRDAEEVMIAQFTGGGIPWAVQTRDPALVLVATEYVRHDIMIDVIMREFGADRLDALWRHNTDLIQVVTGRRPD